MIAVIGGIALKHWISVDRVSLDIDVIGSYDDCQSFIKHYFKQIDQQYPSKDGNKIVVKGQTDNGPAIMECEIAWPDSHTERMLLAIAQDVKSLSGEIAGYSVTIASLDMLYMIKMSHRYLKNSKHFLKTMNDIKLMRKRGASIRLQHKQLLQEREKETYVYAHPKLDVTKDQFFDKDSVPYKYDHDSIHLAVKHLDKPAYMYFKPENSQVMCDRDMFEKCPLSIQLLAGLEEAYVLAIERSYVPFSGRVDRKRSFDIALEKVCTSITSGFFREFCWEHYYSIQALYEENYIDLFEQALVNNQIPLFQRAA